MKYIILEEQLLMNMKGKLCIMALTICWLTACKTQNTNNKLPLGDTSQNALDWPGFYAGVLPCADCSGMATTIQLTSDKTYQMTTTYQGKSKEPQVKEGTFSWNDAGSKITLSGIENGPNQYLVGENRLFQLDLNGNRITGNLAENYILEKRDQQAANPLAGKKWILREIMEEEIPAQNHSVYLEFAVAENRITGFGGCNNFFGSYAIEEENRINMDRLGRTQKYCQGTSQMEDRIFEALEEVDHFTIEGEMLYLNANQGETLLRFELEAGSEEGFTEDV